MQETYKKEYTTLGIAAGGVHATAPSSFSKETAVSVTIYDRDLTPYLGDLAEGGVVIDKRPCVDKEEFVSMVVSGPMLKESLPSGCKQVLFEGPTPVKEGEKFGGFDYIALDVYLDIWRRFGARIGKRMGESIQWEDGEVFPIPPFAERFQHQEEK